MPSLLEQYLDALNTKCTNNGTYTFTVEKGRKYHKIVQSGTSAHRWVHAFLDNHGHLYKPAHWKAPAKKHRWNLDTEMDTVLHVMEPFGHYLYQDFKVA